jgi:hypothetical protein
MPIPTEWITGAKNQFDLTEPADQTSLYALADKLLAWKNLSLDELRKAAASLPHPPLEFRLAAKLVQSRQAVEAVNKPLHIGVIFAMWGEQNRLHPRSENNPHGEDSLRVKMDQLAWATRNTQVSWTLYAIDDGCPHDSGRVAREIGETHPLGKHLKVQFLADALPASDGPLAQLASVDDSRKGGSVLYGSLNAINDGVDAVVYTDADNSVHLGQLGLLLEPFATGKNKVVLGNRKHPEAVLVKVESRFGVGVKLMRHMQRMLGEAIFARDIRDTQAAFKLYERETLRRITSDANIYDFSFDTDWIMGAIAQGEEFGQVPLAFIDSTAESASLSQGMNTWLSLLKGLLTAARQRGVPYNEEMGRVLDEEIHTAADLDKLINLVPPALQDVDDSQLGDPALMSPGEVRAWIRNCKTTW